MVHLSDKPKIQSSESSLSMKVSDLWAGFGKDMILKNIQLEQKKNTVLALIGPSGCGKSTFLRCINRMHEEIPGAHVKGEIGVGGENVYAPGIDPARVRKKIGMVFQKPNPFPGMSIEENVLIGLRLHGEKRKHVLKERLEESLKGAALWEEVKDKLGRPGTSLSGGQQQRLCIARALSVRPEILLMDEPTSALDPLSTLKVEELMTSLAQQTTVVLVTHNMGQAKRISHQTAFFYLGDLIEIADTTEFFEAPRQQKSKEYLSGAFG